MKNIISTNWQVLIIISALFLNCCNDDTITGGGGPPSPILPHYFDHPAWHPGGEWIAAEHSDSVDTDSDGINDRGFAGIWLVNAETGDCQPLISGFGLPSWSPDGKKLALMSGSQIFTIEVPSLAPARVDTNSLQQLTAEGANFYPAWSPDGEWIVYDSNQDSPNGMNFIWKMRDNGVQKICIAYTPDNGETRQPDWSIDGKIVHIRYLVGTFSSEIFVMDSSGYNPIRLTINDSSDRNPKYSPDGTKIAFYSQPRTDPPAIYVMNSNGSNLRKVSPDYAWRFDWSPNGDKIVFLYFDYIIARPGSGELWLINANGTGPRRLTHFKDKPYLF